MTAKEVVETLKQAIDLIEGQQAKINKLEKARQKQAYLLCNLKGQKYELINRISVIKNEAYKEFAERLKEKLGDCYIVSDGEYCGFDCGDIHRTITNLLKEMVGEEE